MGCNEMSAPPDPARRLQLVLDTHLLIWLFEGVDSMGANARAEIDEATPQNSVFVSAITPWEIALLVSKNRLKLDRDVMHWLSDALSRPGITLIPLEPEIAVDSTRLPFDIHPDPADRILVATARHLGATLVTADKALLDLAKKGYFRAMDAAR
jgi:PIN domain nuclease of toxin-antitoxin system